MLTNLTNIVIATVTVIICIFANISTLQPKYDGRTGSMDMKYIKGGVYGYLESDRLGKGSFGQVFKGKIIATGEDVAIKAISLRILDKYGDDIKKIISSEVSVMIRLSTKLQEKYCRSIVRIHDCLRTETNIYMVLEFCSEGDLQGLLMTRKKIPEKESLHIIYQIAQALEFLAENGVAHRDLKPENIFVKKEKDPKIGKEEMLFKLGDFGFAAQKNVLSTTLGTYPYMAPQLFEGDEYDGGVDVWALGVMAHQILFGDIYFIGKDQWAIKKKVLELQYTLTSSQKKEISPEMKDFIQKCLQKNRQKRIKGSELCSHPVFKTLQRQRQASILKSNQKKLGQQLNHTYSSDPSASLKRPGNELVVNHIKYVVYKSLFMTALSRNLMNIGRNTLLASTYLAKRAFAYISFIKNCLKSNTPAFPIEQAQWLNFLQSKDFRDAVEFIETQNNQISSHFMMLYSHLNQSVGKYPSEDQMRIMKLVTPNWQDDIDNSVFCLEMKNWRHQLQNEKDSRLKIISLECLIASNIHIITTYDFESHVLRRNQMTEKEIVDRIQNI